MRRHWWWCPEMKPLINDRLFREELARLEREGTPGEPEEVHPGQEGVFPPASGKRYKPIEPMPEAEVERLRKMVREAGIELINDGASYRAKRQRDFMIWTLETSPLELEIHGGGEPNALWEIASRFIIKS